VRRPAPRPSPRAAATIDAVALLAFVVVGVVQHRGVVLPGLLRTGIPLLVAWFLVALLVGTYRRTGWITMLVTWVVATPLGLLARSVIRGGPWGRGLLEFGAIAMGFTLLFLVGGRLILLGAALLRRPRAPTDAQGTAG
jgi:hypothetical protein